MTENDTAPSILVIGLNRSGTKWLSNLIAEHREVYAVQHADHFGILESNVFNDFARMFPNLESVESQIAFASMWKESDFVQITGVDLVDILMTHRLRNVFEAFKLLMSAATAQNNAKCWLQKCSPVQFAEVGKQFVESKKILIERNFNDVLVSAIENSKLSRGKSSELRLALNYCLQNQVLGNIRRSHDVFCVSYENLKADPRQTFANVMEFLGLDPTMRQECQFIPNTSFSEEKSRPSLKYSTWIFSKILRIAVVTMPAGLAFWLWKRFRRNAPSIVRGTFRVTHEKSAVKNT